MKKFLSRRKWILIFTLCAMLSAPCVYLLAGTTTNFHWDYGIRRQIPWWSNWETLWQNVDTELHGVKLKTDAWVDIRSYLPSGYVTNGSVDYSTQIAAALSAAIPVGKLSMPAGTFLINIGLSTNIYIIQGAGKDKTIIKYTGTGVGLTISGDTALRDLTVQTTDDAATGVMITDGARKVQWSNVYITGNGSATNTGKGVHLYANTAWLGGIDLGNIEIQGFKYQIYCQGTSINNTLTALTGNNVWLIGRSAGVVSGSRGIYMDSYTNGIGSAMTGVIESCDVGIEVVEGAAPGLGLGISFYGDFEGNNTNWVLGKSFNGIIFNQNAGNYIQQGTNSLTNKWFQNRHLNGTIVDESWYGRKFVTTTNAGTVQEFSWYYGDSIIDGNSPFLAGGFFSAGTEALPQYNYLRLGSHKLAWGNAPPTGGDWTQGDVEINTGSTSGGSWGWVCITSGTPGTWKAMPNLAP